MAIHKRIVNMSKDFPLAWIDDLYYEDMRSICRVKEGRNNEQYATALRYSGLYRFSRKKEGALEYFKDANEIFRALSHRDTFICQTNMMDYFHSNGDWASHGKISKRLLGKNNIVYVNKPSFMNAFPRESRDIVYCIDVFERFRYEINHSDAISVYNKALRYMELEENKRHFSDIDRLSFLTKYLKLYTGRNSEIPDQYISWFLELLQGVNKKSNQYVSSLIYLADFVNYRVQTKVRNNLLCEIAEKHLNAITAILDRRISLTDIETATLKLLQIRLIMACKEEGNIGLEKVEMTELSSHYQDAVKHFFLGMSLTKQSQGKENQFLLSTASLSYALYDVGFQLYGCDFSSVAEDLISQWLYPVGKNYGSTTRLSRYYQLWKQFILDQTTCDFLYYKKKNLNIEDEFNLFLSNFSSDSLLGFKPNLSSSYLGFALGNNWISSDNKDRHFCSNYVYEFYYGSDYGVNVSDYGFVDMFNDERVEPVEVSYLDSLYFIVERNEEDSVLRAQTMGIIQKNQWKLIGLLSSVNFGDSMKLSMRTNSARKEVSIRPDIFTHAAANYYTWGNSSLENIDRFYFWKQYYDWMNGRINDQIKTLDQFIDFGLTPFFVGFSKRGGDIDYLSGVFYFGIASSSYLGNTEIYIKFKNYLKQQLSSLNEKERLHFINNYLWFVWQFSEYPTNKPGESETYLLNDELTNDLFRLLSQAVQKNKVSLDMQLEYQTTLSLMSHLNSFDASIFQELKSKYPSELRVFRNEAIYYFRMKNKKKAFEALEKAKSLGYEDVSFFLNKEFLSKKHKKIKEVFIR